MTTFRAYKLSPRSHPAFPPRRVDTMWEKITFAAKILFMKYPIFFFLFILIFGCRQSTPQQPTEQAPEQKQSTPPDSQPNNGVQYSTDSPELLRNLVRTTLRTELALTLPVKNGDIESKKSYSFDIEENNGRPTWVIKEKWHNAATGKLYAGAEYMLLWSVVDKNSIELVESADGKQTALQIKPTSGDTFLYHPYSNDPDVAVNGALIGWFDRTQDATLQRAITYMRQLADNMDKWEGK